LKMLMNFTTNIYDTERYTDNADLKAFYREFGFDGLELMRAGVDEYGIVRADDVIGIHLRYFITWMDLWKGNEQRLIKEFDNYDTVKNIFGGTTRETLTKAFIDNLNAPPHVLPEYLVFHVSDCQIDEAMLRRYHYGSEEVIDASIELADSFSEAIQESPVLLFENLWYPGLNMLEPELTYKLLEKVKYPKTGVMLDFGHLLNTNTALRTIDEGVDYIHKVLDMYGDLSFIKGIHLHQSLSGKFAQELIRSWKRPEGSHKDRWLSVNIFRIDTHQPFVSERVNELIGRIQPEYLVIEQLSANRYEHALNLEEQLRYLNIKVAAGREGAPPAA